MNRQQKRRLDRLDSKTAEATALICMIALHESFGFGETRLGRFMEAVNKRVEDPQLKISDIVSEAERITGWKIQL